MTAGKARVDRTTGVTAKQELFCAAVLTGQNAAEAYKSAYNTADMSEATIKRRAIELLNNSRIKARLDTLRAPAQAALITAGAITMEGHLAELARLRDLSITANQMGSAITAEMARGKVAGFYVERRETGEAGAFDKLDAMRKQDAKEAIEAELDRRARLALDVTDVEPK